MEASLKSLSDEKEERAQEVAALEDKIHDQKKLIARLRTENARTIKGLKEQLKRKGKE